jgi:hypothetical protein
MLRKSGSLGIVPPGCRPRGGDCRNLRDAASGFSPGHEATVSYRQARVAAAAPQDVPAGTEGRANLPTLKIGAREVRCVSRRPSLLAMLAFPTRLGGLCRIKSILCRL